MAKPLFQHRHYVRIAAIIAGLKHNGTLSESDVLFVSTWFAANLANTNPNFDRGRFESACEGKPQTRRDAA